MHLSGNPDFGQYFIYSNLCLLKRKFIEKFIIFYFLQIITFFIIIILTNFFNTFMILRRNDPVNYHRLKQVACKGQWKTDNVHCPLHFVDRDSSLHLSKQTGVGGCLQLLTPFTPPSCQRDRPCQAAPTPMHAGMLERRVRRKALYSRRRRVPMI